MKKARASTGGHEFLVEQKHDGVHVNGHVLPVEWVAKGRQQWNLRVGAATYEAVLLPSDGEDGIVNVLINGRAFRVEIDDEARLLLKKFETEQPTKVHAATLRSPMPGKITRVLVSVGELVEAGQGMVILEAMKMENELRSPAAGIVKSVRVEAGDAVEKNALLLEIA